MQREQIIEALVVDTLIDIFDRNRYCWLQEILENGFRGFARMSTEDLWMEMQQRGLLGAAGEAPDAEAESEADLHGHFGIAPADRGSCSGDV